MPSVKMKGSVASVGSIVVLISYTPPCVRNTPFTVKSRRMEGMSVPP